MSESRPIIYVISTCWFFLICLAGCYEEKFETSAGADLSFSLDTLRFDTVFTELGSATRNFRVYNDAKLPVQISNISLEKQESSSFRLNVDGLTGNRIQDIEIEAQDSIWVFVEVTIDPDLPLSVSPFIVDDQIVFETNGNIQKVRLESWGQNANYLPNRSHSNKVSILSCDLDDLIWDDPKPYVIYGTLLIDSCHLIIPQGARIYVHGGVANNDLGTYNDGIIYTLPEARISIEGSLEHPVLFRDDRLEEEYIGLWGGLRFGPQSGPHAISHAVFQNAAIAVTVDSASTLEMENVIIESTAGFGLFGRHASVNATNCLFHSNGAASVALTYGGNYRFSYCTVANFGNDSEGLVLNNFYCTDPLCLELIRLNTLESEFTNCIIVGSAADELLLSDATPEGEEGYFNYQFNHCIVRVNDLVDEENFPDFFDHCVSCIEWTFADTLFENQNDYDFHLDSLSIAEQKALPLPGVRFDLEGNLRDFDFPDIGCYEYTFE
jgi:hypothetical protein